MLRRQFRHFADCLTRPHPDPETTVRRRTEDTRGGFRELAREIGLNTYIIPSVAFSAASLLFDTLDWLNPWHDFGVTQDDMGDEFQPMLHDDIYPHL